MIDLIPDFMLRAALAGFGVSMAAGLLGCFVVWRRMAYFGDATAHSSLLGVALALGFSISVTVGVLGIALMVALISAAWAARGGAMDTILGVLAHSALAIGLVAMAVLPGASVNLEAYLFGDILAVNWRDLAVIWGGAALICGVILWRWQGLLTSTLSTDLAWSEGIDPKRESLMLTLALAIVVAVAIKVVGALLITAMLIIPAAAARSFSTTPERMAIIAVGMGLLSVAGGLTMAWVANTPAGPSIVCVSAICFALSQIMRRK